mgnify:CR=1 FL=1
MRLVESVVLGASCRSVGSNSVRGRQLNFDEVVSDEGDPDFPPRAMVKDAPRAGLSVEEFIGKHDALSGQDERFADPERAHCCKGMGYARQNTVIWFRPDFDEGVGARVAAVEQVHARRGDKFTENLAARARGKKICAGRVADPRLVSAVIADRRVVERELHESRETHCACRPCLGAKAADELGRCGRRWWCD